MPNLLETTFTRHAGIDVPLICGAMYPCSNPELIAATSEAGGIGIIQPISMQFVHGHDLREGIRYIRELTDKPIGFNAIVEQSSQIYLDRMKKWIDVALEEGVRLFVTALGNPDWVVKKVHAVGGVVYHDVTARKWGQKALDGGVDGLICVNSRAGGHAGQKTPSQLMDELGDLGVPLVCAGGIGDEADFVRALKDGWAACQLGTRFIATHECKAHLDYKKAIVGATGEDVVLTDKISGVPVAIINTPYVQRTGTRAGPVARRMLRHPKLKHYVRSFYSLRSIWQLRAASQQGGSYRDYWQAGKSVDGVERLEFASDVVARFAQAARDATAATSDAPATRD